METKTVREAFEELVTKIRVTYGTVTDMDNEIAALDSAIFECDGKIEVTPSQEANPPTENPEA